MNDPDVQTMSEIPSDATRMFYGGFEVLNDTGTTAKPDVDGMISPVSEGDGRTDAGIG